ncbi:MAG: DNA primase small subunit PriS [Infirmifilum sp.]
MEIPRLFKDYYHKNFVAPPSSVEKREFAFTLFNTEGMFRHISFRNAEQLNRHLREKAPQHAYYSTAYYRDPSAPEMDDKGWEGADLVFDIDVDHIDTPCKPLHDSWKCRSCGAEGWGFILKCPSCGSDSIERQTWVCDQCISVAREETLKLIDILEEDFGLTRAEMSVAFSGHRGFHVHVENKVVAELDQEARREIADYVRGLGIDPDLYMERVERLYRYKYSQGDPGWRGRIARLLGLRAQAEAPMAREELRRLILECVEEARANIDEKVTMDVKRLIRLPGTLHGKTGLKVLPMTVQELEATDARGILEESIALPDEPVRVELDRWPRKILDHTITLRSGELQLPLYLAVYIALNSKRARIHA